MHTLTIRRCMITCILVVLLSAAALYGLDRYGMHSRVFGRGGTIQSRVYDMRLVNGPQEAYQLWRQSGYRGRTIVYVSSTWESFDPGTLIPAQMYRAYPLQLYNLSGLIEENHLTDATFLYVASLNKICRRIVAILPEVEISRIKGLVRSSKDIHVSEKGVFASRQGYPRWFISAASLSDPGEPVLLFVGASYFKTAEPEDLYRQLAAAGLRSDCVVLCNESGKETVSWHEIAKLKKFGLLMGLSAAAPAPGPASLSRMNTRHTHLPS